MVLEANKVGSKMTVDPFHLAANQTTHGVERVGMYRECRGDIKYFFLDMLIFLKEFLLFFGAKFQLCPCGFHLSERKFLSKKVDIFVLLNIVHIKICYFFMINLFFPQYPPMISIKLSGSGADQ